ncbi:DNA-directed RNA polymerase specialized sigma24 family protein [Streptacidiphilus sp. MAP5-52]
MTAPAPRRRTKKQAQAARRSAAGAAGAAGHKAQAPDKMTEVGADAPSAAASLPAEAPAKAPAKAPPKASGAQQKSETRPQPPPPPSLVTTPQNAAVQQPSAPTLSSLAPAPGAPGRHGSVGHAPPAATRSVDSGSGPQVNGHGKANGTVNGKVNGNKSPLAAPSAPTSPPTSPPAPPPMATPMPTAETFDALYRDAGPRLVQQTYLLTGSQHRAAHCVRRAFQQAWTDWRIVSLDSSPEGWVRAAAFELALSPWHRGGPRMQHLLRLPHRHLTPAAAPKADPKAAAQADPEQAGSDKALMKALMRLPRPQRRALVLHDVIGLDWAQTAAEVEGSTPVTFGRVARGRRALAEAVPGVVGSDPEQSGFGRRLGARLRRTAERGCAGMEPLTAPGVTRTRARLHDHGLTLASGVLTLATAGGLAASLLWGTPMHPAERPIIVHPNPNATQLALYSPAQAQPKHLPHQRLPSIPVDWAERARYEAALAKQKKQQAADAANSKGKQAGPTTQSSPTAQPTTGAGTSTGTSADQNSTPALCRIFSLPCDRPGHSGHSGHGGHQKKSSSTKKSHH